MSIRIQHKQINWRVAEVDPGSPVLETGIEHQVYSAAFLADLERIKVQETATVGSSLQPCLPTPSLRSRYQTEHIYTDLHDRRFLFVGSGAGSILLASYLTMRGAQAENMTLIDSLGEFGGIWSQKWAQSGGFNNPASLQFFEDHHLPLEDRAGTNMHEFLHSIAQDYLADAKHITDTVMTAKHTQTGSWVVRTDQDLYAEADYLTLSTGINKPHRINGRRISSNLDYYVMNSHPGIKVERYQRELTEHELTSGRPIMLIGLGNSTAAMIHKIQQFEDQTGVTVPYYIITDLPAIAIEQPTAAAPGRDKPLYRNPAHAYLTGYSGDLDRDHSSLQRALAENRIITDANSVYFDPETSQLIVTNSEDHSSNVVTSPHVFALIGYEKNTELLQSVTDDVTEDTIRPSDGAIYTPEQGYLSNAFAVGACAATTSNPNAAVIPGILGQVGATSLTIGVREFMQYN